MYDARWFKNIKQVHLLNLKLDLIGLKEKKVDIAVAELEEEIEQEYVKPACFPTKRKEYSGDLLVSFKDEI